MRILCLTLCLLAWLGSSANAQDPGARFAYLPPAWSDRVVLYHGFEQGIAIPEINRLNAKLLIEGGKTTPSVVGRGWQIEPGKVRTLAQITTPNVSAHRPLTVMMWWRLDTKMILTSGFHMLSLRGPRGYLTFFANGKSEWCALQHPTWISQLHNFGTLVNHHNQWMGDAWTDPGEWHHVALTIRNARELTWFIDGTLRDHFIVKGRDFKPGDTHTLQFVTPPVGHPMTVDELIVVDRALSGDEIKAYLLATRKLGERTFQPIVAEQTPG